MAVIAIYPSAPAQTLLPPMHRQERSRVEPEVKLLVPTSYYSERLDLTGPAQSSSSMSKVKFHSHRIINYYKPKLQGATCTSVYATIYSKKFNKDVFSPEYTLKGSSSTSDSPGPPIQTKITDVTYSSSLQPPITSIRPVQFDAASHLHEIIPFTTPIYAEEDGMTRSSVPNPDDFTKPILEVTCVDRTRFFWSDFKITWSTAWNDQRGCQNLFRAMERRGLVTGWSCKQAADNNGYVMQAEGHRPRSPRRLVADAIREAFELVRIQSHQSKMSDQTV